MCGKIIYETQALARFRAGKMRERDGQHSKPYFCSDCGGWHLSRMLEFRQPGTGTPRELRKGKKQCPECSIVMGVKDVEQAVDCPFCLKKEKRISMVEV